MNKSKNNPSLKIRFIYIFIDFLLISLIFLLSFVSKYKYIYEGKIALDLTNLKEYSFIFFLWIIFTVIAFERSGLYTTNRALTIPKEISRVLLNLAISSILVGAVIFFAQYKFFSRQVFLVNFFSLCLFLNLWRTVKRVIVRRMLAKGFHNINVLIIGAGSVGRAIFEEIAANPWLGYRVAGFLDDNLKEVRGSSVLGKTADFSLIAKKYFVDEVIITIPSEARVVSFLIKEARDIHLGISVVPQGFYESASLLDLNYLGTIPLLNYKERKLHPTEFIMKKALDLLLSVLLVLLLMPLFLVIAIMIKLDSRGPVFYIQKRAGAKGRIFNCYKFRSMVKDAEKLKLKLLERNEVKDGVIFKIKDDPRITRFGRFLRKFSLDELPQLFNVIKGEMSLVGPRPPTLDEVEKYHYSQMQRLSIKPGITGLSQIKGRSKLTFRRWVKWDLWYVNNWSFGLDLKILLLTIPAVLKKEGAY